MGRLQIAGVAGVHVTRFIILSYMHVLILDAEPMLILKFLCIRQRRHSHVVTIGFNTLQWQHTKVTSLH
jgi:hypothetical protein